MDAALLGTLFGRDQSWHGPCTVIMDCEAAVATLGTDALLGGGAKQYAPRMVSGRILADAVCLLAGGKALLLFQHHRTRQASGEEFVKQIVTIADPAHVVAVEFPDTAPLAALGIPLPAARASTGSHPGVTPMRSVS